MAQQTRAGTIDIISNVGSFGEAVFKIGMTRRLEPADRIKEASDASVPFAFDVVDTSESRPRDEGEVRAAHGSWIARQNEPDVAENRAKRLPCDNSVVQHRVPCGGRDGGLPVTSSNHARFAVVDWEHERLST